MNGLIIVSIMWFLRLCYAFMKQSLPLSYASFYPLIALCTSWIGHDFKLIFIKNLAVYECVTLNFIFFIAKQIKDTIFAIPKRKRFCFEENGPVVQLVRMPPCHGGGRGFESRPVRKSLNFIVEAFFVMRFFRLYYKEWFKDQNQNLWTKQII